MTQLHVSCFQQKTMQLVMEWYNKLAMRNLSNCFQIVFMSYTCIQFDYIWMVSLTYYVIENQVFDMLVHAPLQ